MSAVGGANPTGGTSVGPSRAERLRARLGSVVLGFELFVAVFATLLAYGLQLLPKSIVWYAGGALVLLIVAALAGSRSRVGLVLGWLAQVVLLAAGALHWAIAVIAVMFVALWCVVMLLARRERRAELAVTDTDESIEPPGRRD